MTLKLVHSMFGGACAFTGMSGTFSSQTRGYRYIWVPYFHSVALALKKTNFISRIIGQFNKSVLLPLCQPCIQFCFYTSFLLGLNKCFYFSNFQRIYNMKNLKKI